MKVLKKITFMLLFIIGTSEVSSTFISAKEYSSKKKITYRAFEDWEDADVYDGDFSSIGSSLALTGIISGIVLGGGLVGAVVGAIISAFGLNAPVTCYYRKVTQYKIVGDKMYRRYKTTFYKDSGHYEYICGPIISEEFEIHSGYKLEIDDYK